MTARVYRWPRHIRERCTTPECTGGCNTCALFICRVCGGAEGDLPTDYPGERMSGAQRANVYDRRVDYTRADGWVARPVPAFVPANRPQRLFFRDVLMESMPEIESAFRRALELAAEIRREDDKEPPTCA